MTPQILYSFIISHILYLLIKYLSLSEKNIIEMKNEKTINKAIIKTYPLRKYLIIKYILFYFIGLIFLLFCWYYLSSFGAVFKNTQIYLIYNTFLSLGISFIYPFFLNIFPVILRIASLKDSKKRRLCMFKISKIIQFI